MIPAGYVGEIGQVAFQLPDSNNVEIQVTAELDPWTGLRTPNVMHSLGVFNAKGPIPAQRLAGRILLPEKTLVRVMAIAAAATVVSGSVGIQLRPM